jgi:two-component system OmpR family response regulator
VIVAPDRSDVGAFAHALTESEYKVQLVHEPQRIAQAVIGGRPDVVVVDLRDRDPLAERILRWVAGNGKSRALVITEAHDVDARIWALDLGVSDHLAAPFATREALARVEHLLAQQRVARPLQLVAGDLTVDLAQRSAVRNGKYVALTPREVSLLVTLIEKSDQPVTKQELLGAVWGAEARSQNVVEANVSSLRRKLHALGPPVIHTLHRAGYVFRPVRSSS